MKEYILRKCRNADGSIHEREKKRKGQLVRIPYVEIGKSILIMYDDLQGVNTSTVRSFTDADGYLKVTTNNTYYEFEEVK